MAHELDFSKGKAAIAYRGETPWHGLGQQLTAGASIPEWTEQAGLNFEVQRAPIVYGFGDVAKTHPTREVFFRNDTGAPLGILSKGYNIVQPAAVMDFFGKLAERGGFELETAGALKGGTKIWALAKVGDSATILGDKDEVRPYLLLATSFDGSLATTAKFTAVRVVCNNTITVALHAESSSGRTVRVPHSAVFNADNVQDQLGLATEGWGKWVESARAMAAEPLSGESADGFLLSLFDKSPKAAEDMRESTTYRRIMDLFSGAAIGADLVGGRTQWAMLNAVTQFVDHERGNNVDNRLDAAWFGAGDKLKSRAYDLLAV